LRQKKSRSLVLGSNLKEIQEPLRDLLDDLVHSFEATECFELGAGLGKVSAFLKGAFSWKKVTAIEVSSFMSFWGKLLHSLHRTRVVYQHADITDLTYPKNSVLYCYLNSEILNQLYEEGRLKSCLVISLTFKLSKTKPIKTISLSNWQKELVAYDFRT